MIKQPGQNNNQHIYTWTKAALTPYVNIRMPIWDLTAHDSDSEGAGVEVEAEVGQESAAGLWKETVGRLGKLNYGLVGISMTFNYDFVRI